MQIVSRASPPPGRRYVINDSCRLYGARRGVIKSGRMKRTLTAVAAAVLMSMMALMFLGGLLKKAARVIDGLHNGSR
jgi:hypothetical protein